MNDHLQAIGGAGRVMLITGASSGIGAATARLAVENDFKVALAARSLDRLQALESELGENALAIDCDVTDFAAQAAAVARTIDHIGRLDIAFANAGFGAKRGFAESTPEQWREMVLTNILGPALTIRAAQDEIKRNRGHFLLTGSVAGTRVLPGSLYSATKFAVHGMAEALRQDLNGTGVRTTLIAPGMVDTPFFDDGADPGSLAADDIARTVIYALTQPEHVDINMLLVRSVTQNG